MKCHDTSIKTRAQNVGFTIIEQLFALLIAGLTVSAIVAGFWQCVSHAEWSGYSRAAQNLAIQRMEQTRAAKWNPQGDPAVDELQQSRLPTGFWCWTVPSFAPPCGASG
jgi:Tfp pilus assembly protein PilV